MRTPCRQLLRALSVAVIAAATFPVHAEPSRANRTQEPREAVALLQKRVLALAALERITVQSAADALGVVLQAPVQYHERRREWPIRPDAVIGGGEIIEAGSNILIALKPAAALQISLDDLAVVLMKQPYYLDPRRSHVGADSVATVIYAIDHAFLVKGGELRVQVPVTVPDGTPNHGVKAIRQGYDQALRPAAARGAQVDVIYFSTDLSRAEPAAIAKSLDERRRQRAARKR